MFSLSDVKAMSEECDRQQSGELSVSHLAVAVYFAHRVMYDNVLTVDNIEMLGSLIEPQVNAKGFRTLPVMIHGKLAGVTPNSIRHALEGLCDAYNDNRVNRNELYQEFESIHPFADGNGRVGFVLYNLSNLDFSAHLETPPRYIDKSQPIR